MCNTLQTFDNQLKPQTVKLSQLYIKTLKRCPRPLIGEMGTRFVTAYLATSAGRYTDRMDIKKL